jgi:hypothetical protein
MIVKISKAAASFRRVLDYNFSPAKEHELLGGNMRGECARDLARELDDWRTLNERVGKPVFHCSLAAAPEDHLTPRRWLEVAETLLRRLGYQDSPWVAIRHHDRRHDHVHLVACRMDSSGHRVESYSERRRSREICRQIEREMDLRPALASSLGQRTQPTQGQLAAFAHTGAVAVKARLQEHLDLAARGRPTMRQFVERAEAQGIEVRTRFGAPGRVEGISFAFDGVAFQGGQLGRAYSWKGLQQQARIGFEPDRDLPTLRAAAQRATTRAAPRKLRARPMGDSPRPVLPSPAPAGAFAQAAVIEARADVEERRAQLAAELAAAPAEVVRDRRSPAGGPRQAAAAAGPQASREQGSAPAATAAFEALRRLPEPAAVRRDVLRAGRALGEEALQALSPRAVAAFAAAARFFGWVSSRALGRDRGAGRADDDLAR